MTAPNVIWAVPPIGGTFEEGLFMATTDAGEARPRYIRADAPELVALVEEMKTFCRRVEIGEVRSKRSYAAFKAALAAYEALK